MNTYVQIRKPEFDSAMNAIATKHGISFSSPTSVTREWNDGPRTTNELEVVYYVPLGTTLDSAGFPKNFIKIYSSIPRDTSRARGLGKDAIRVSALMFGGWSRTRRVHRTLGWQERVAERILDLIKVYNSDERADKQPCLIETPATAPVEDFVSFLEGPTGHPGLTEKVLAAVDEALMNADFCLYCGSKDINGIIPGVGPACAYHIDHVGGETVLSFFSVV